MIGSFSASGHGDKDRYDFLMKLYGSGVLISFLGIIFTPKLFKNS